MSSYFASLADIIDYLHESVFPLVPGLPQLDEDDNIINLLKYEPRSIQTSPTLYTLLDTFQRNTSGQVTAMKFRLLHRICVQWQDNEESEAELLTFVHSLPSAVDQDPTLGGLITMGLARISEGQSGFVLISGTKYRSLDFFSDIPTKGTYKGGI
jgi:hypothetical protein